MRIVDPTIPGSDPAIGLGRDDRQAFAGVFNWMIDGDITYELALRPYDAFGRVLPLHSYVPDPGECVATHGLFAEMPCGPWADFTLTYQKVKMPDDVREFIRTLGGE